tara:strand:- start:292 stop:450 length:159 start_codon:yes stop_codon:yes gene_type:complete
MLFPLFLLISEFIEVVLLARKFQANSDIILLPLGRQWLFEVVLHSGGVIPSF